MTIAFKEFQSPAAAIEAAMELSFSLKDSLQANTGIEEWHFSANLTPDVLAREDVQASRALGATFYDALWARLNADTPIVGVHYNDKSGREVVLSRRWGSTPEEHDALHSRVLSLLRTWASPEEGDITYETLSGSVALLLKETYDGVTAVVVNESDTARSSMAAKALKEGWEVAVADGDYRGSLSAGQAARFVGEALDERLTEVEKIAMAWGHADANKYAPSPAVRAALDALRSAIMAEVEAKYFPAPRKPRKPAIDFDEDDGPSLLDKLRRKPAIDFDEEE